MALKVSSNIGLAVKISLRIAFFRKNPANQFHMRKYLYFSICTLIMLAFTGFVRVMMTGISVDFGHGFFAGIVFSLVLGLIGQRCGFIEPRY